MERGTSSEYLRELIRKDKDRLHLRGLLLAGAASAPAMVADGAYFKSLRDHIDVWRVLHDQRDIPAWMMQSDADI